MATVIQQRRGTKAQHDDGAGFTGAAGEITVDTTDDTLRVHDGSLKGGHVMAKLSDIQASDTLAELSDTSIASTAAGHILIHDGSDSFDNKAVSGAITINSSGVTTLASGQALTNLGGGSGTTFLRKDGTFTTPTDTQYTGGTGLTLSGTTFNVDAAQTGITSLGTLSGLTTGATTVNGALIVNNDTVDIVSTDAGATEKPTLSLYRNSASASATDEMGSIDFYGNNNRSSESGGPQKILYGSIYAAAVDVNTGTEDGSLKFSVANAGGVEDPIFSLFNYGIVMGTDNDLRLGQRGEIWFEGASNSSNETVLYCVDPTQENTVLLPDDSGTLSLDGENQTSYRTGEIIEVITGYADGSTLAGQATSAGAARNFALEDVTALQSLTSSYGKINGTLVNYLPPVGTKTLEIEYGIFVGYESPDTGIMHHKLSVGGTYVTNTRMTHRDDSALNKYVILKSILTVDGSGDVAAGNVDSWNSAIALQLDGREYGGSAEVKLHITHYYDGSTSGGNQVVVPPSVKITAIG